MPLRYLTFDYSEDTDGTGVFDALASTGAAQAHQVRAEVEAVLNWAASRFPHAHGPLADGFTWDHDVRHTVESQGAMTWHTTSLSVSGSPAFCDAFRTRFLADAD